MDGYQFAAALFGVATFLIAAWGVRAMWREDRPVTTDPDWLDAWLDDTPIYSETCAAEAERIAAAELDHDLARLLDGRNDR